MEDLQAVLEAGADMVTIGTAITGPHLITERFFKCTNSIRTAVRYIQNRLKRQEGRLYGISENNSV